MSEMRESALSYFHRVAQETPTEFWINNATAREAAAALEVGAVGATTNPTYPARLLKEESDYMFGLIDQVLGETTDDNQAADLVYQRAVSRLQRVFHPVYVRTSGRYGYVAIQGDPRVNTDVDAIVEGAFRYLKLGENMIIKVPATPAGALAMEKLVAAGVPTIATLSFSVDQAVYMAEAYRRALKQEKVRPVCYVTFIAGILDAHLAEAAVQKGNVISKEVIRYAGCEASRVAYRIYKDRGYEAILMGGGARGEHHFTELVGGAMAITIGWNLAETILQADKSVVSRIDAEAPADILRELETHLPDYYKAAHEKSLRPEEFRDFGPVVGFQNTFLNGIETLMKAIASRRRLAAQTRVRR
jgi:transaldolase